MTLIAKNTMRKTELFIIAFLIAFGLGARAVAGQAASSAGNAGRSDAPTADKVKNIILMIGDGMGVQQASLAILYRQRWKTSRPELSLEKLMRSKNSGLAYTSSHGDIVPDSGAATTAMSCGIKTLNQMIAMNPEGYACETILEKAARLGKATGLVTTSRLTHATPAAFASHRASRWKENQIAEDIIEEHDVDVLLGGGIRHLIPRYRDPANKVAMEASDLGECKSIHQDLDGRSRRKDQRDLIEEAKAKGYHFVCNKAQLEKVPLKNDTRLLGLFSSTSFPMIQERNAIPSLPNLAQMTLTALDILEKDKDGFFLMVEGGLIDYAGHDNDAGSMLQETLDFDRAIGVALKFAEQNPDTLLIVTGDHETGGFNFAYGPKIDFKSTLPSGLEYKKSYDFAPFDRFDYLDSQAKSFRAVIEPIEKKLYPGEPGKADPDYGMEQAVRELIDAVQGNSKFTLSEVEARQVLRSKSDGEGAEHHDLGPFHVQAAIHTNTLGRILGAQSHAVWAAGTHTSSPVPVVAYGPQRYAERVQGYIDNTDIARIMEDALRGR